MDAPLLLADRSTPTRVIVKCVDVIGRSAATPALSPEQRATLERTIGESAADHAHDCLFAGSRPDAAGVVSYTEARLSERLVLAGELGDAGLSEREARLFDWCTGPGREEVKRLAGRALGMFREWWP